MHATLSSVTPRPARIKAPGSLARAPHTLTPFARTGGGFDGEGDHAQHGGRQVMAIPGIWA